MSLVAGYCQECGAAAPADIDWCPRCFQRRSPLASALAAALAESDRSIRSVPVRHSRWRAGVHAPGPAGRLFGATIGAALVGFAIKAMVVNHGPVAAFAGLLFAPWLAAGLGLLVWSFQRVRVH